MEQVSNRYYLYAALMAVAWVPLAHGQVASSATAKKIASSPSVQQAMTLVESGRCTEALPTLRNQLPRIVDKQTRYHVQMAILRCAMAVDDEETASSTLLRLRRDDPDDPEVLYMATHYFSEMGSRAAQELESKAPNSYQAQKLQAEALESQGKNDDAAAIYNKILEENPKTAGIHYRLGQIDLAIAGAAGPTDAAKKEFEQEIAVDPLNASAHFILGELARRTQDWPNAIREFSQASKLDVGFSEAYLALGMSLVSSGSFAEALPPLKAYVKMQPADPAGHYQLALAYARTGDKEGAAREMALQAQAAASGHASDTAEGHALHP
jgi:predicted Zn-dependent protease